MTFEEDTEDHEDPGEEDGAGNHPPPADDVEGEGGEDAGGELHAGGDGERPVDGEVQVGDVAHVGVEEDEGADAGIEFASERGFRLRQA